MDLKINELDVYKLNVSPGDTIVVKVRSEDMTADILQYLKTSLEETFGVYGAKVIVFGLGMQDDVIIEQIKENKEISCGNQSYCLDCNCGKKAKYEGESNA